MNNENKGLTETNTMLFNEITRVIEKITLYGNQPKFGEELDSRRKREIPEALSDQKLLRIMVELIAYSQNANSKVVKKIVDSNVLDEVFADYDIDLIAQMNPCDLVDEHWSRISGIRQQSKLFQVVMLARKIKEIGSLYELIINSNIPHTINTNSDIDQFWIAFKLLRKAMDEKKVPFIRSTTTLLHLLLHLGYDCVKPDSAVMKAAAKFGIVEKETGEKNLALAVRKIQEYSLFNAMKPVELDFFFLIHGGQAWASGYVTDSYKESK
jgi:hypothetical protein